MPWSLQLFLNLPDIELRFLFTWGDWLTGFSSVRLTSLSVVTSDLDWSLEFGLLVACGLGCLGF